MLERIVFIKRLALVHAAIVVEEGVQSLNLLELGVPFIIEVYSIEKGVGHAFQQRVVECEALTSLLHIVDIS